MRASSVIVSVCAGAMAACMTCCSTPAGPLVDVPVERYPAAFDAARLVLRDMRFDLERVDARGGVISTAPKTTAGLATPWDVEQQTAGQEFEDLLQHQRRVVRIVFEPAGDGTDPGGNPEAATATGEDAGEAYIDLVEAPEPTRMRVSVFIERVHRPHWRIDSTSIRLDRYATDPLLQASGMQPRYEVAIAEDRDLAARVAGLIRDRMATSPENGE